MNMKLPGYRIVLPLLLLLALFSPRAMAQTCNVSATAVSFAAYSPLAALPNDSTGQVAVTCSAFLAISLPYTIRLSTGGSGRFDVREMASGAQRLNYNLYTSVTYSSIWGNGSGGYAAVSGNILLAALNLPSTAYHTVYGRIPAAQNAAPGTYLDTITVTVDY